MSVIAGPFGGNRYNSFGAQMREKFGCRVYKVIVDAGFTCPNRDGTVAAGGCTYCNNDAFRPQAVDRLKPIPEQVSEGIHYLERRYRARRRTPMVWTTGRFHVNNRYRL